MYLVLLISQFFITIKTIVTYWIPCSYLTGFTAAWLQWHFHIRMWFKGTVAKLLTFPSEKLTNGAPVTPTPFVHATHLYLVLALKGDLLLFIFPELHFQQCELFLLLWFLYVQIGCKRKNDNKNGGNSLVHYSLWPSDAIWRYISGTTSTQVMAWRPQLMLIIGEVLWHSPNCIFTWNAQDIYPWYRI